LFCEELPLTIEENVNGKEYLIAHAWYDEKAPSLNGGETDNIYESREYTTLWFREIGESYSDRDTYGKLVDYKSSHGEVLIHGHSPLPSEDLIALGADGRRIWNRGSSINIDCGCFLRLGAYQGLLDYKGNLAAFCLDDGRELYALDILDDETIESLKKKKEEYKYGD
jgi:hypothetical protein